MPDRFYNLPTAPDGTEPDLDDGYDGYSVLFYAGGRCFARVYGDASYLDAQAARGGVTELPDAAEAATRLSNERGGAWTAEDVTSSFAVEVL